VPPGSVAAGTSGCWLWETTISQLIGEQHIDGLLRCEYLVDDLAAAGLTVDSLPRWNESYRRQCEQYFTDELLAALAPWVAVDRERFGFR
jgi:polyphosphate kinase